MIVMWAQLITVDVKPGRDGDLERLSDLLEASEQADSGLLRLTIMQAQSDPGRVYFLAVFESEEKGRARESDPRRQEALVEVRQLMGDMLQGAPEFVDMTVFKELTPQPSSEPSVA